MDTAILPIFLKFKNAKNHIFVLSVQKIVGGHETKRVLKQNCGKGQCFPSLKPSLAVQFTKLFPTDNSSTLYC